MGTIVPFHREPEWLLDKRVRIRSIGKTGRCIAVSGLWVLVKCDREPTHAARLDDIELMTGNQA